MSTPKPAVDIQALNDFFNRLNKKATSEFSYARMLRIIDQFTVENPVHGYTARGQLESYFGNFEQAELWFRKALELSDYQSSVTLQFLLDSYIKNADIEKVKEILALVINKHPNLLNKNILTILIHFVRAFVDLGVVGFIEEILKDTYITPGMENIIADIPVHYIKLKVLGISIEVYQQIIGLLYITFFEKYNGSIKITHVIEEDSSTIRAYISLDDAEELFELNNQLDDRLVNWYTRATDDVKDQLDKVIFYFQAKPVSEKIYEVTG